jgi:hypothetical protein
LSKKGKGLWELRWHLEQRKKPLWVSLVCTATLLVPSDAPLVEAPRVSVPLLAISAPVLRPWVTSVAAAHPVTPDTSQAAPPKPSAPEVEAVEAPTAGMVDQWTSH